MSAWENCGAQVWQVNAAQTGAMILATCLFMPGHAGPHSNGHGFCWSDLPARRAASPSAEAPDA